MYNILYIHTHDTGRWNSVYGKQTPTPALDTFAQDALSFRNAFCVSPTCSPSRGALLTGCYPHQNGLIGLAHRGFSLTEPSMHLAAFLAKNGFETVLAGVQHEQNIYDGSVHTEDYSRRLGYEKNISWLGEMGPDKSERWKIDRENARRVVSYLDEVDGQRPFFLSYGMFETHRPYPKLPDILPEYCDPKYIQVPGYLYDSWESREDTAQLHYSLKLFDDNFAQVMEALKRNHLYDKTIIISTTDHGLANPFAKCTLTDDGIGVSFMMRIPGYENVNGSMYEGLVSHLDVYPTLCEVLGLEPDHKLEGTSLFPIFNGKDEDISDAIYSEINFHTSYEPARSVRTKRYKYIRYYDSEWDSYNLSNCDDSSVKDRLLKAGWASREKEKEQLYDLYFDPSEKNNLVQWPGYQEVLQQMRQKLIEWQERTQDKIPDWREYRGLCKLNRRDTVSPTVTSKEQLDSIVNVH